MSDANHKTVAVKNMQADTIQVLMSHSVSPMARAVLSLVATTLEQAERNRQRQNARGAA
jgi:hypothetical protein